MDKWCFRVGIYGIFPFDTLGKTEQLKNIDPTTAVSIEQIIS
jgi:hypothetical protein